jgi:FAD synthetase
MTPRTVIIFGVFDGVHEGHLEFIKQARIHGERLVAIVARDSVVEKLKGKTPLNTEEFRIKMLLDVPEIDLVLLGDIEEGTYHAVKEIKPDVIYLGYDQHALSENLTKAMEDGVFPKTEIIFGKAHQPEIYHSSLLNNESGN